MSVYFPRREGTGDATLRQDINDLADRMGPAARGDLIRGVTVGTGITPIPHGLRGIPTAFFVIPYAAVAVGRPQPPDAGAIYLQAASSVVCDVLVIP